MRKSTLIPAVLAVALGVAACSTKGAGAGVEQTSTDGVKADYGVTDDTITLGILTDASGVFKDVGLAITHGEQLWATDVNADGGVCGRQIKLTVRDSAYQTEKAVTTYPEMKDDVLGMVQLLGSPMVSALESQLASDKMLTITAALTASYLASPNLMIVGPTDDIEDINGLAFLQKNGMIKDGDRIGHIYIDSEYGQGGLNGSKYYAKLHDQTIEPVKVVGTDTDMTPAVTSLKSKGVTAIVLTGSPAQMTSTATQMAAQGLRDIPLIGNDPTFSPTIFDTPAKDSLQNYYRVSPYAPYGATDNALTPTITKNYQAAGYTDPPNDGINYGYAMGMTYQAVLEKACAAKDLTRAGLLSARKTTKVDTQGLTGALDYTRLNNAATRETAIEQVDPSAPGGVKIVDPLTTSDEAVKYKSPLLK